MRQVFLALIVLLAGMVLLSVLYLGEFPPRPQTHAVDHEVKLNAPAATTAATPAAVPAAH